MIGFHFDAPRRQITALRIFKILGEGTRMQAPARMEGADFALPCWEQTPKRFMVMEITAGRFLSSERHSARTKLSIDAVCCHEERMRLTTNSSIFLSHCVSVPGNGVGAWCCVVRHRCWAVPAEKASSSGMSCIAGLQEKRHTTLRGVFGERKGFWH